MKILELIKQTQEFLQGKNGAMQISRPIKDIFDANSWRPTQKYFLNFPWDVNESNQIDKKNVYYQDHVRIIFYYHKIKDIGYKY